MKKIFSLLLAVVMIVGCMLAVTSCGAEPELEFTIAEANLKLAGYSVQTAYTPEQAKDFGLGIVKGISARNSDTEDFLQIAEFDSSSTAKLYVEQYEIQIEQKIAKYELKIEYYEYMLEEYGSQLSSSELQQYNESLANYRKNLANYETRVVGRSGNIAWYGTEAAVEASKR